MKYIKRILTLTIFIIFMTQVNIAFASIAGDNIIISEVEYDSIQGGSDQDYEWFELFNPTKTSFDLENWIFTDDELGTTTEGQVGFANSFVINPGEYKVIAFNANVFLSVYDFNPDYEYGIDPSGDSSLVFGNSGDELTLFDKSLNNIDFVSWEGHTSGWNIEANPGETIARTSSVDTDTVSDWEVSQTPSPGTGVLTIINENPTDIEVSSSTVDENTTLGTNISTLTTTDQDTTDTHTYTLIAGIGDEDNAKFAIVGDQLNLNFTPDFENPTDLGDTAGNNTYSIRVQTDDGFGGTFEKVFIITINDVNDTPVITSSTNISLVEGSTRDVVTVTATDQDAGDSLTFSISGELDSSEFSIDINTGDLTFNSLPDFENPSDSNADNIYEVTVSVTDGINITTQDITISVTDINDSSKGGSKRISKERLAEIFGNVKVSKTEEIKEQKKEINKCSFKYKRLIKYGTHGSDVKSLQETLNSLGFNTGIVDGWYGPNTYKGIIEFQTAMGIYRDGIVGPQTTGKINNKCSN